MKQMATQEHGPAIFRDATTRRTIAEGTLTTTDGKTVFDTGDASLANRVGHIVARSSSQKFGVVKTQLTTWPSTGVSTGPNGNQHTYLVTPASGI
jgi:hypothetical protein